MKALIQANGDWGSHAQPIDVSDGSRIVLGRGHAFGLPIDDKRCSRQQTEIRMEDGKVILKTLGINPGQIIREGGPEVTERGKDYVLKDGDQFSLIGELFAFRIFMEDAEATQKMEDEPIIQKKPPAKTPANMEPKMEDKKKQDNGEKRKNADEDESEWVPANVKKMKKPTKGRNHVPTDDDEMREDHRSHDEDEEMEDSKFSIKEMEGDLFESPCSLMHCVSRDLKMDKGIAAGFKKKFGGEEKLKEQNCQVGDCAVLRDGHRYIFYLITKEKYFHKPNYEDLKSSLVKCAALAKRNFVNKIDLPQIGCGLDKLNWGKVKDILVETFADTGIEMRVFSLRKKPGSPAKIPGKLEENSKNGKEKVQVDFKMKFPEHHVTKDDRMKWHKLDGLLILDSKSIKPSNKVIGFDMDGTLIEPKSGKKFPMGRTDWKWWDDKVPTKLKKLNKEGYKIVIFTNQLGISKGKQKESDITEKITDICEELGFNMQAFVAYSKDAWRKPCSNMWRYFVEHCNGNKNPTESMYVGDAAGRANGWKIGRKKDHSCGDRSFAFNLKIPFQTPDEYFLGEKPAKFAWDSIDPNDYLKNVDQDKKVYTTKQQEMIVNVGMPASGKSSFTKRHLVPAGYVRVNRDELKTKEKCIKVALEAVANGKSVVIDNTNPAPTDRSGST
eukprot:TRINITY_DN4626_c0_g3_i2.p1 TRINITY_DN4626_c0_g3~~TRINITY_DN4626_c0_g3_i2.p1  ORF type:complete len:668 (+),score=242.75 TRINITY_DN4626_c0_g3_i2:14-2017(+)